MKKAARAGVLEKRDALTGHERAAKSRAIAGRLAGLAEYVAAKTVLFYVDFRSEVATRGMIRSALGHGKRVVVPKVVRQSRTLELYEITDPDAELVPGYMGIPEPEPGKARAADESEVDLVVLPGVGFDARCRRLGYGGGYYDRLIERLRPGTPLVALAFDMQVVGEVPSEVHDKSVHKVVTETRVITG